MTHSRILGNEVRENRNGVLLLFFKVKVRYSLHLWKHRIFVAHIKNLFYTFIWNFIPELIEDGVVYAGIPPLYRLKSNKDIIYLKDDDALADFKSSGKMQGYQLSRLKGLGEMSPEETEEALVNPDTRIIKQITVADTSVADTLFDTLMGSSVDKRKKYIEEHSEEANVYV